MNRPKCHRCDVNPADLGFALFTQTITSSSEKDTNETEHQLCSGCINDLREFLSGKLQSTIKAEEVT